MFLPLLFYLLLCQEVAFKFYHVAAQQDTGSQDLTNLMTYDCNAEMELRLNYTGTCTESRSGCLITKDSISIAVFHYTT